MVRMSVWLLPAAKSVVATSVRTMLPSAVKAAPLVELSALSAEMLLPPVGEVMVTLAQSRDGVNVINPKIKLRRTIVVFIIGQEPRSTVQMTFATRTAFISTDESCLG